MQRREVIGETELPEKVSAMSEDRGSPYEENFRPAIKGFDRATQRLATIYGGESILD